MLQVCVLAGGNSDEREVSLRSGAAVAEALKTLDYNVTTLDSADGLGSLQVAHKTIGFDVVFLALHGIGGEDGKIQKMLCDIGLCYTGSGPDASALCFDKWVYKQFLSSRGYPVTQGEFVNAKDFAASSLSKIPFVLKPHNGGSSIDTFIVRDPLTMPKQLIETAFIHHNRLLIESLVEGVEITVGVLLDKALTVIEIIPPADEEFDYANKYNGKTAELCPPQHVSTAVQKQAQELAAQLHVVLGCDGFSRTDMIVTASNELVILETNTIPGLTRQSLFPKAAAASGISMPSLVDALVKAALKKN